MKKVEVPSSGNIREYPVNRLLQMILDGKLSGCLSVSRESVSRRLFVNKGMITYATSTERRDRLGEIFVAQGTLKRKQVNEAFKKGQKKNTQLGMMLLVEGQITSQDLFQGVSAQVVTILERMRGWRKGDFEFESGREPIPGTVLLRIPLSLYLGSEEKKRPAKRKGQGKKAAPAAGAAAVKRKKAEKAEQTEKVEKAERAEEAEQAPEKSDGEESSIWSEVSFEGGLPTPPEDLSPEKVPPGSAEGEWTEKVIPDIETPEEENEKLIEEVTFQVQELRRRRGRDPYTFLGVKSGSGKDQVHEAYHYLAKLLHPDQHPQGISKALSREAGELFKEAAAAFQEAGSSGTAAAAPAKQGLGRVPGPKDALQEGDETREMYYWAKECIAKGNYWQASDAMRQVVRRKPDGAMYRNLLGICLMHTGRRLHEAEEHIREAIRLDPGNPDFIANLGLVYKSGRFYKKARKMFEQTLMYDRKHELARQELRKLPRDMEQNVRSQTFWKKLFGG
jgi:tetratricopeptide (TPR) repeat protein